MINIHKHFGMIHANDGVTLSVESGTLHGILGENGAGKSTLMKVLSGFLSPDQGQILVDGRPVKFSSPSQAVTMGIGMLHQDPLDFPALTVLDNFLLGQSDHFGVNRRQTRGQLLGLANQFDFKINPEAWVSNLSIGERQQLEILRLLWMGVRLLILDEPTTAISAQQKGRLFSALRKLTDQGKTVLFVSHKLEEVNELCSRVSILAHGKVAGKCDLPCPTERLVEMMFGQKITHRKRPVFSLGNKILELNHLTVSDWRVEVKDLTLQIHEGEIIGLAGLEGSGQQLFLKACAGLMRPKSGRIHIYKRDMTGQPYSRYLEEGVIYISAGRLEEGLISGMNLMEHFALMDLHPPFWVNWSSVKEMANQRIQEYKIRGQPTTLVEELSGGNQQRMLLSMPPRHSRILLMEHPTRGLDLESTNYIWQILFNRSQQGATILYISSELDELLNHSHRILVFFSGHVQILETHLVTGTQLGEFIGGKGFESSN